MNQELEVKPEVEPQQPKLVPQPDVDKVVGAVKHAAKLEGIEEGRRQAMAEMQLHSQMGAGNPTQQPMQQQAPAQMQSPQVAPPMQQMAQGPAQTAPLAHSPDDIQKMINDGVSQHLAQERQRMMQDQQAQQWKGTVDNLFSKINVAEPDYHSFEKDVLQPLQLDRNPHLVTLASMVDNPNEVLRDLKMNPSKIATLTQLSMTNPHLAMSEIQSLSNSIKANKSGAAAIAPKEPLSQVKPSTVTTDNGQPLSVKDLRRKYAAEAK